MNSGRVVQVDQGEGLSSEGNRLKPMPFGSGRSRAPRRAPEIERATPAQAVSRSAFARMSLLAPSRRTDDEELSELARLPSARELIAGRQQHLRGECSSE